MYLTANEIENVPLSAIMRCEVVSFKLSHSALGTSCISRSLKIIMSGIDKRISESLMTRIRNENQKRTLEENVLNTINDSSDLGHNLLSGTLLEDLENEEWSRDHQRKAKRWDACVGRNRTEAKTILPLGQLSTDIFSVVQICTGLIQCTSSTRDLFDSATHRCVSVRNHRRSNAISLDLCQVTLVQCTLSRILPSLLPQRLVAVCGRSHLNFIEKQFGNKWWYS